MIVEQLLNQRPLFQRRPCRGNVQELLGARDLATWIALGLGTDTLGDWPANLGARRLGEWFREGRWLDGLSPDEIVKQELATGVPIVYRLNEDSSVASKQVLD